MDQAQDYLTDTTNPTVVNIIPANTNPNNASSVNFTVTFSEPVTGVDASDFTLTSTGISGESVTGITGSGNTYVVSVNTGSGEGTLRLNVVDDGTIVDSDSNPLAGGFTSGESYTIDRTPPTVSLVTRNGTNPTNVAGANFTVTFSEPVTGVEASDFTLTTSGVTSASVTGVSGSGNVYSVSINTGTGNGTIRLDVVDDDTIVDSISNPLAEGYTSGQSYTIDRTPPTVISSNGVNSNPTASVSVNFTVTFSESVTGVNASDFSLTTSGVFDATVSGVSGSGSVYMVTVSTGSGNGTIRLNVVDDDSIKDAALNPLGSTGAGNGSFTTGQTFTIDKVAPTVNSSLLVNSNPTAAVSINFSVTFSESVTGVNTSDFNLTTNGISGANISSVSGSGNAYTVTVSTGNGSGTIRLNVVDDDSIKDTANNSLGGVGAANGNFTNGQTYTVDKTPPTVSSSTLVNPSPTSTASVNFSVTFPETVTGVNVSDFNLTTSGVSGATVSGVSGSGSAYTVTVSTGSGNGTIRLNVVDDDSIRDAANTPLGGAGAGNGNFTSGAIYSIIKSATFADVPLTYWASSYIERVYMAGIASGCYTNPLRYCPEDTVTRAQLSIFLLKGIHGSSYTPPAVGSTTGLNDVATNYWAAAWIKQLVAEGITSGCSNANYCPESNVTRAEMAIFLVRTFNLP